MHGGDILADVLQRHGVRFLFTLCGGHISPILVGAKARGIRVIDVRHEVTAVFAADAVSRLTGVPGVAAVTAGPGVTNTITAIKNAQLAQSPLILLGGATATLLRGRGALQDIDQMALISPHVKLAIAVKKVRDLGPALSRAFRVAQEGVPGPVFIECPVDLLYDQKTVREMSGREGARGDEGAAGRRPSAHHPRAPRANLPRGGARLVARSRSRRLPTKPAERDVARAAELLRKAKRPVVLLGSQATLGGPERARRVAEAIERLGVPAYLSGMARGLLGRRHSLFFRHNRAKALKEADLVILAGVPCDFRLNYGLSITRKARVVALNRERARRANEPPADDRNHRRSRRDALRARRRGRGRGVTRSELARDAARARRGARARDRGEGAGERRARRSRPSSSRGRELTRRRVGPRRRRRGLRRDGVVHRLAARAARLARSGSVRDPRRRRGVRARGEAGSPRAATCGSSGATAPRGTASPRSTRSSATGWAFSRSSATTRRGRRSPATRCRMLGDDVATMLRRSDYHLAAEGLGAKGMVITKSADAAGVLNAAVAETRKGTPVVVNAHLARTDFRKGSISM